jgi:ABC-type transporter Mla subunit MlaD
LTQSDIQSNGALWAGFAGFAVGIFIAWLAGFPAWGSLLFGYGVSVLAERVRGLFTE